MIYLKPLFYVYTERLPLTILLCLHRTITLNHPCFFVPSVLLDTIISLIGPTTC
jgi:hypothetical protein